MKIVKFSGKNFLSWESVEHSFIDEVIAITGENKTQEDQGGNGTGKSSLEQIIYYAISGNNIRGVVDKKLIRNGCEEASASIEIHCPIRKETLSISRTISFKHSSKLAILKNNEPVTLATVNDGNKYIVDWIGISPEDLKSYFIICKEFYKSFFKSSNTEKLALISRFINFSYIDKTKDIIDSDIADLNASKREVERSKNVLEGKMEVYEANYIKEESRDLEQERQDEIEALQRQIADSRDDIKRFESENNDDIEETKTIDEEISKFKGSLQQAETQLKEAEDSESYDETLASIKETILGLKDEEIFWEEKSKELDKKQQEIKRFLREIEINLSGVIECPKCKHKFLTLQDTTLEEEELKKQKFLRKKENLEKRACEVDKALEEFNETIGECVQIKNETEKSREEVLQKRRAMEAAVYRISRDIDVRESQLMRVHNRITSRNAHIEARKTKINSIEEQIKEVREKELKIDVVELELNIKETSDEINSKEVIIKDLDQQIYNKSLWINRFKDFKRYMALDQLKNIQYYANEILKKQKSDLRLLLEGFKVDSKGKVKEEITPYVLREEAESFWYYSGGERARVEIAVIIAFQQMINLTNPYGGLEFLMLDEVLEGLSEEGLYNIIDALSFVKQPILLITHISNQNIKCRALKVEKVNDVSKLV